MYREVRREWSRGGAGEEGGDPEEHWASCGTWGPDFSFWFYYCGLVGLKIETGCRFGKKGRERVMVKKFWC